MIRLLAISASMLAGACTTAETPAPNGLDPSREHYEMLGQEPG